MVNLQEMVGFIKEKVGSMVPLSSLKDIEGYMELMGLFLDDCPLLTNEVYVCLCPRHRTSPGNVQ